MEAEPAVPTALTGEAVELVAPLVAARAPLTGCEAADLPADIGSYARGLHGLCRVSLRGRLQDQGDEGCETGCESSEHDRSADSVLGVRNPAEMSLTAAAPRCRVGLDT